MKIVDCPWEIENLNKRVVSISIENKNDIDVKEIQEAENNNDYIVIKAKTKDFALYQALSRLGYYFTEAQFTIRKKISDIDIVNDKVASSYFRCSKTDLVNSEDDLNELLEMMTEGMFSTDRIYLDDDFGPSASLHRYRTWIKNEYFKGTTILKHYYRNKYIGFSMCKVKDNIVDGLLSGTFEKYQNAGLGMFLPLIALAYRETHAEYFYGLISSNNLPVIKMYNRFAYDFVDVDYIFVKHIK